MTDAERQTQIIPGLDATSVVAVALVCRLHVRFPTNLTRLRSHMLAVSGVGCEREAEGMNNDVISADYTDYKVIKTRSVVQVVLEVPIENWRSVVDLLGMPLSGSNIPVAIARLARDPGADSAPTESPQRAGGVARAAALSPDRRSEIARTAANARWDNTMPKRPFHELPPSQQAGILCGDPAFQRWLGVAGAITAAMTVRRRCKVQSRSQFDTDKQSAGSWAAMRTDWERASGRVAEDRT